MNPFKIDTVFCVVPKWRNFAKPDHTALDVKIRDVVVRRHRR